MGDDSTIFATTDRSTLAADAEEAAGMPAALVMITGDASGTLFDLEADEVLVGRGDAVDLRLEFAGVSRRHLRLRRVGEDVVAEDVGSRNGSFVNDRRIDRPTPLSRGDLLRIGPVLLKYLPAGDPERIAYERLYRRSQLDRFTGCYTKSYFLDRLDDAIGRRGAGAQTDEKLSLVVFDLDRFKTINDTHGHDAGDRVLKALAELLRAHAGGDELLARYGGEEFVLLLDANLDAAAEAAERVRRAVETQELEYDGRRLPVTLSAGVAEYAPGDADGAALFRRADAALYRAKQAGRNRVCAARDGF
jgi:diguanylate cyclase (GGDEF)-like protein